MKILFSALAVFLTSVFFSGAMAAEDVSVQPCDPLIGMDFPENESWENAYVIQGADGSIWQRAIASNKEKIILEEGETSYVTGTGQPNSEVQVFIFAPKRDDEGRLLAPGSGSTCVNIGKANAKGFFTLPINARVLWGNIGDDLIIDAYTRLEKSWDQYVEENDNQNFYIGTNLPMRNIMKVDVIKDELPPGAPEKECELSCDIEHARTILAQKLIPSPASEQIIPGAFNAIYNNPVIIGRMPGDHTFYAYIEGKDGDDYNETEFDLLKSFGERVVSAEFIKRKLYGYRGAGGFQPGLTDITEALLEEAANGAGPSTPKTQAFVRSLKNAMTNNNRAESISIIAQGASHYVGKWQNYAIKYIDNLLPQNRTEDDWASALVDIIAFWSGGTDVNACIIKDDRTMYKNFAMLPGNLKKKSWACRGVYIHGISPSLRLSIPGEVILEPNFLDIVLTYAEKSFSEKNAWKYLEDEEKYLYYRYELTEEFTGEDLAGTSCISPDTLDEYVSSLTNKWGISSEEGDLIQKELRLKIDYPGNYLVSVVNPTDIAKRFSWKINGRPANIAQLFFRVEEDACSQESISIPEWQIDENREGFEAGTIE
jgi:hypothetical protein